MTNPSRSTGCLVLLSGGLDSVAALLLEAKRGPERLAAVFIDYGQPMLERERESAWRAADECGVQLHQIDISGTYRGFLSALMASPVSGVDDGGRDTAFLPGRNALLLSLAASLGCRIWPGGVALVVGFNAGDAAGFPDCRRSFCAAMQTALVAGGAPVQVLAPWIGVTKRWIVQWVRRESPGRLHLIESSWSCYSAKGPCGACTACKTRAEALG